MVLYVFVDLLCVCIHLVMYYVLNCLFMIDASAYVFSCLFVCAFACLRFYVLC